jgi:hypothetical protein
VRGYSRVTLALKVLAGIVVVVIVSAVLLRVRKIRRDEMRKLSKPVDRRLMAPPPSPYAPSKGFRLLDGEGQAVNRPPVERPRLDPSRHYVFNELTGASEEVVSSQLRHKDDWFLSRSSHRSTFSILMRRLLVFVVIALVVATLVTYYVHHSNMEKNHSHTSTTTTVAVTTTTLAALSPTSTSGDEAIYRLPLATYRVTVVAVGGSTTVAFETGPNNSVEWQGTIASGDEKSIILSGNARVTIGSPQHVTATIAGRTVVFPTTLPPVLALVIRSSARSTNSQ